MEPPVRSYNPSGSGEPRKRAPRTSKKTDAPRPAKTPTVARLPRTQTLVAAKPAATPVHTEPEPRDEPAALATATVVDAPQREEAGPVVGVADFEEIFTRFQTPITNFVFRLVGNREQAYDLTQDVFVKVYRALSSGTTIQSAALSSWLYRIASNTATDALRRRRLISWLPLSLFNEDRGVGAGMPGADGPAQPQSAVEDALASAANSLMGGYDGGRFEQRVADREIVESVLKKLPPKYAACLLLYEHEGFSCAEIAEVLHVSASAVKMRLMRARERFIALYQQETGG
jgi:RNA polymerase sigma-70 factor (ECF subfamily)